MSRALELTKEEVFGEFSSHLGGMDGFKGITRPNESDEDGVLRVNRDNIDLGLSYIKYSCIDKMPWNENLKLWKNWEREFCKKSAELRFNSALKDPYHGPLIGGRSELRLSIDEFDWIYELYMQFIAPIRLSLWNPNKHKPERKRNWIFVKYPFGGYWGENKGRKPPVYEGQV